MGLLDKIGFCIDEEMVGTHRFEPGFGPSGGQSFMFKVSWGTSSFRQWLLFGDNFLTSGLIGTITARGLCADTPCAGTLALRYFSERRLRYEFTFLAKERVYRFVGEKVNIRPWNLPVSHTTCFGRITDVATGQLISTALVFFRLRDIPRFLRSFRLTLSK